MKSPWNTKNLFQGENGLCRQPRMVLAFEKAAEDDFPGCQDSGSGGSCTKPLLSPSVPPYIFQGTTSGTWCYNFPSALFPCFQATGAVCPIAMLPVWWWSSYIILLTISLGQIEPLIYPIHSFIYLFNHYVVSACYILGTGLGVGDNRE